MKAQCPICDGALTLDPSVEVSEVVACSDCKNKFEVISVDQQKKTASLKEAPKVEEDWGE